MLSEVGRVSQPKSGLSGVPNHVGSSVNSVDQRSNDGKIGPGRNHEVRGVHQATVPVTDHQHLPIDEDGVEVGLGAPMIP